MNTIAIREAGLADLDALVPLFDGYRQFYGQPGEPDAARAFLRNRIENGESVVFLAFQDSDPVGFTQLYPSFSSVSLARIFVLNDLFVRPTGRNQGIGTRLLHAACEHARSAGAIRLTLSTAHSNATAQAVYAAAGWQRDDAYCTYEISVQG